MDLVEVISLKESGHTGFPDKYVNRVQIRGAKPGHSLSIRDKSDSKGATYVMCPINGPPEDPDAIYQVFFVSIVSLPYQRPRS